MPDWKLPKSPPLSRGSTVALDNLALALACKGQEDFERLHEATQRFTHALSIADVALTFGQVERATLHPDGAKETDSTHTVMLAMVVADLARMEGLDVGLAVQFAVVHDLPETYAGDTSTARELSPEQTKAKAEREHESLLQLTGELGKCWSTTMMLRYEEQIEKEARLVRFVDKILPKLTHVLNGGSALAAIGMDEQEIEESHRRQGAKLRELYPEFKATAALFDFACDAALIVFRAHRRVRTLKEFRSEVRRG